MCYITMATYFDILTYDYLNFTTQKRKFKQTILQGRLRDFNSRVSASNGSGIEKLYTSLELFLIKYM